MAMAVDERLFVYDKTFTNDAATARHLFDLAESNGTPCWTSSALRFSTELACFDKGNVAHIHTEGPGVFDNYSIHQIETIVRPLRLCPSELRALRLWKNRLRWLSVNSI